MHTWTVFGPPGEGRRKKLGGVKEGWGRRMWGKKHQWAKSKTKEGFLTRFQLRGGAEKNERKSDRTCLKAYLHYL